MEENMIRRLPWIALAALTLSLGACDKNDGKDAPADKASEPASDSAASDDKAAANKAAKADPHSAFTDLSVDAVDKLVSAKDCVAVDANGSSTREKYGVLPNAVLLSKTNGYDASELPDNKDTKLVFYCGGQRCTAAPKAATVAKKAGYTDVNVMRAGIRGWVDAGKNVAKPAS
jgi:rhodanese-related sulfurtransferase